jgi:hypothetical protein
MLDAGGTRSAVLKKARQKWQFHSIDTEIAERMDKL